MLRGALSWWPLAGATALAIGLHVLRRTIGEYEPVSDLRRAFLLLALGAAFAFDDDASQTIEPAPAPLAFRRTIRATMTIAGVAFGASVMVALAASAGAGTLDPMLGRLLLELGSMLAIALFGAAVGTRRNSDRRGGLAGAGTLLVVTVGAAILPARWTIFVSPEHPRWVDAGRDVALTALVAAIGLVAASLDPARRRIRFTKTHPPEITAAATGRITEAARQGGGSI